MTGEVWPGEPQLVATGTLPGSRSRHFSRHTRDGEAMSAPRAVSYSGGGTSRKEQATPRARTHLNISWDLQLRTAPSLDFKASQSAKTVVVL